MSVFLQASNLIIGRFVRHFMGSTVAAKRAGVKIGTNSRVFAEHFGTEPWLISIGCNTTVSSEVKFLTHDGVGAMYSDLSGRRYLFAGISVGDNCFIGLGSIILPGVTIGNNCVVGAGSVVTRDVQDNSVVAGNPAKVISTHDALMRKMKDWPSDETRRQFPSYESFVNFVAGSK